MVSNYVWDEVGESGVVALHTRMAEAAMAASSCIVPAQLISNPEDFSPTLKRKAPTCVKEQSKCDMGPVENAQRSHTSAPPVLSSTHLFFFVAPPAWSSSAQHNSPKFSTPTLPSLFQSCPRAQRVLYARRTRGRHSQITQSGLPVSRPLCSRDPLRNRGFLWSPEQ